MTDTTTDTTPTERPRSHSPCGYHGSRHWRSRVDPATLSGPQRLAHRTRLSMGWLISLVVRVTFLMLLLTAIVVSWRWIFDVLG